MLIVPDTNFLVYLTKYKLWHELERIYGRYTLLVLPQVAYELRELGKKTKATGEDKEAASLALEFIKKMNVKPEKGHADAVLVQIAQWLADVKEEFIIGTMDKELIQKLKKHKAKILMIRQKTHLTEN